MRSSCAAVLGWLLSFGIPNTDARAQGKAQWGSFGVDLTAMDRAVHPGDDFWSYAFGAWARTTIIPADRGALSQVSLLNDLASSQVETILQGFVARRSALHGDELRVADYYTALMDRAALEARGAEPLLADLQPIRAARTSAELAKFFGANLRSWQPTPPIARMPRYAPAPFAISIAQDRKEPTRYVVAIRQGGLGLPNRDYYLKTDATSQKSQDAYRAHVANLLRLTGVPAGDAPRRSEDVYAFERALASTHWSLAETRDADKTYNPWTLAELNANAPGFDWSAFLAAAGLGARSTYIVGETTAIVAMAKTIGETRVRVLQDWLAVRLAKDRALVLSEAFIREELGFSSGTLGGATEIPSRSLQAVELTAVALVDAVSKPYIALHFSPATKQAMDELVKNLLVAMDRRLERLSWMTPETKVKARAKLASFTPMIGFPDTWKNYDGLVIRREDAYGNFKRADAYRHERQLARIDRPVDRREWWMMPITANAYASPSNNQIVFPAAYLQPPHFDLHADPAVNYGAIGQVIGHEISHHFDDQGSKYDREGRLARWWTDEDLARFNERKARLVAQYSAYEPLPGLPIRGAQTLGENIADNAGLAIAYDAYRLSLAGKEAPVLEGFTGDQRFFLGRAQVNKALLRDEELRKAIISGVHSPSKYRSWSVRNHDAWYAAFDVSPGRKLYLAPEERVKIWE